MAKCSFCGAQTSMPFTCKFCEQSFCSKHRLPENHDCQGLENYREQSREEGKVGYDVIKNDTSSTPDITSRSGPSMRERLARVLPTGRHSDLPITYILLGIMFVVFGMEVFLGQSFVSAFALTPDKVIAQPWTIITSLFLHGSLTHILVNAIVLFSFGTEVERILGDTKYLTLVFGAGIASSLGFAITGILFNMPEPAVGISGALFGLVGFIAMVRPEARVLAFFFIPLKIRTAVAFFGIVDLLNLITQILHAAGIVSIQGIYSLVLGINVASSGHLSGLIIGLIYGYYLRDKYAHRRPQSLWGMNTQLNRF